MKQFDKVDNEVFESSCKFSYDSFMKFHRKNFDYIYDSRFKYSDWRGECRVKREGELNFTLFRDWSGKKIEGSINYKIGILTQRAALRRVLKPTTDATEVYLNLYEDVYGYKMFDTSDGKLNKGLLKGIAEEVFKHDIDWIINNYSESIKALVEYYDEHYPGMLMTKSNGSEARQEKAQFRYSEAVMNYEYDKTRKENSENLGVSESYLSKNNLGKVAQKNMDKQYKGTKKGRTQDWKDRKKAGEVLGRLKYEDAKELYPTLKGSSVDETIENYKNSGYQISRKTICKINKELKGNTEEIKEIEETGTIKVDFPKFDTSFNSYFEKYKEPEKEEPKTEQPEQSGFQFNLPKFNFGLPKDDDKE